MQFYKLSPEDSFPARGKGSPGAQCRGANPAVGIQAKQETERLSPVSVQAVHSQTIQECVYSRHKLLCEGTWCGSSVCTEESFFGVNGQVFFQITRSVQPVSLHRHLLSSFSSSLAGDACVLDQLSCPVSTGSTVLSTSIFNKPIAAQSAAGGGCLRALLIPGCSSLPTPNFSFK